MLTLTATDPTWDDLESLQEWKLGDDHGRRKRKRSVLLTPSMVTWIGNLDVVGGSGRQARSHLRDYAQVAVLLDRFILGDDIANMIRVGINPPIKPLLKNGIKDLSVWEFRTKQCRLFGWWMKPRIVVIVDGAFKDDLARLPADGPGGYEDRARSIDVWRQKAGIAAADIWTGTDLHELL